MVKQHTWSDTDTARYEMVEALDEFLESYDPGTKIDIAESYYMHLLLEVKYPPNMVEAKLTTFLRQYTNWISKTKTGDTTLVPRK